MKNENTCKQWYGEFMDDNIKFLNKVLTPTFQENYHIRTVEETTLGHRDGILVPVYTVYVRVLLDTYQEEEIKEIINVAYKDYYKTNVLPIIEIRSSARYACEYKGKYYHMCIAYDSPCREYPDYEIYEISRVGYEAILDMKQAGFKSQYDEKKVVRICSLDKSFDKAYEELRTNRLSEKLLDMVIDIC